ncbi:MAG: hypothetical protein KC933_18625 [Myxococcales bacterium]|nr:hypothetical protein [Myxococcales bacterium]MCB9652152.1 hypothetical protein [Deltaproteobacteria bacterium]
MTKAILSDSPAWRFQVWAAFAVSMLATASGIYWLPVDAWMRGYLGMGLFFTVSSCFALAKTVRDQHEQDRLSRKLEEAEAERILRSVDKAA